MQRLNLSKIYFKNELQQTNANTNQLEASRVSNHTEELWYNKRVCLQLTIYILGSLFLCNTNFGGVFNVKATFVV